jgi:hypothetical protein
MNYFTIAIIILFFTSAAVDLAHARWLQASFLALSGAINIVVWLMGR